MYQHVYFIRPNRYAAERIRAAVTATLAGLHVPGSDPDGEDLVDPATAPEVTLEGSLPFRWITEDEMAAFLGTPPPPDTVDIPCAADLACDYTNPDRLRISRYDGTIPGQHVWIGVHTDDDGDEDPEREALTPVSALLSTLHGILGRHEFEVALSAAGVHPARDLG